MCDVKKMHIKLSVRMQPHKAWWQCLRETAIFPEIIANDPSHSENDPQVFHGTAESQRWRIKSSLHISCTTRLCICATRSCLCADTKVSCRLLIALHAAGLQWNGLCSLDNDVRHQCDGSASSANLATSVVNATLMIIHCHGSYLPLNTQPITLCVEWP